MTKERFARIQPWVSLVVRLGAGIVMIAAGMAKMVDLDSSVFATRNYRLLPEAVVPLVGNVLPFLEVILGVFLVLGVVTRWAAFIYLAMLAAFVFGTAWAWAKGLQIDCGCFGGDGTLAPGVQADYLGHIIDQAGFIALGAWVAVFPRSALSFDGWLRPNVTAED